MFPIYWMHAFQGVGRGPYLSSWVSPLDLLAELFSELGSQVLVASGLEVAD